MNFLRDTLTQLRNAFLAMPVASRMISVMLVGVIAIGLAILIQGGDTDDMVYLFGGDSFNEQELAEMELAFSKSRLSSWKRENKRIRVPSESMHEYLRALAENGTLPAHLESAVEETLSQSNPLELSDQFRYRTQHARLEDIGRQIQMFADVKWARVQYDRSEKGWSHQHKQTASVTVMPEGERPLSPSRQRQIRDLVCGSFAGLSPENVAVIDTNASFNGLTEEENEVLATKRRVESDMELRLRKLLSPYGDIRLLVTADIDPTLRSKTTKVEYSDRIPINEQSRESESETIKGAPGGVPGVQPNALAENEQMKLNETRMVTKTSSEERDSEGVAGQTFQQTELAPLLVRQIKVSIGLPKSYYRMVYRTDYLKENPDAKPEEIPKMPPEQLSKIRDEVRTTIQSAVAVHLNSVEAGDDRLKLVQVWDYSDMPETPLESPGVSGQAISWLAGSWQTIALLGLALVALLVARSLARTTPPAAPPAYEEGFGLEVPTPEEFFGIDPDENEESNKLEITGVDLQGELTELIENNPDVAANVLRSWLGEAA